MTFYWDFPRNYTNKPQSIEFSTGDDDEDDEMLDFSKPQHESKHKPAPGGKETLEQLLLARNKKLGNELTVLRVSHQDLTSRLQTLQNNLDITTAELKSARDLNTKLEDDLYKLQSEAQSNHFSSAHSVVGTRYAPSMAHGGYAPSRGGGGGRVSPTSSIISGFTPHMGGRGDTLESLRGDPSANSGGGGGQNQGILPMVTAQRDRFKQRITHLEDELAKANTTISSLRQEVATLQKDNLQLYEKTRYISTYSSHPSSRPSNDAFVNIGGSTSATPGGSTSTSSAFVPAQGHDRYRAAYEANISPFQAFRGREAARAMKRMGPVERGVLGLAKVILATRLSRSLFAGYIVCLHVAAFMMLYWRETCGDPGTIGISPLDSAGAAE